MKSLSCLWLLQFFRLHQRQKTKKRLSFLIHSDSILFDSFENAIYGQRFSSFPPIYQHFSSEIHNNIKRNDLSLKCHDRYVDVRPENAMGISCNHLFKLFVRLICFDYWIERLLNKRNPCCFLNIFFSSAKKHTHTRTSNRNFMKITMKRNTHKNCNSLHLPK